MFNFAELVFKSLWQCDQIWRNFGGGIFFEKVAKGKWLLFKMGQSPSFLYTNNFFIRRFSKNITVWANFKVFVAIFRS